MSYSAKSLNQKLSTSVCQMTNSNGRNSKTIKSGYENAEPCTPGHVVLRQSDTESFSVFGVSHCQRCNYVLRASRNWLQPLFSKSEGEARCNTLTAI